MLRNPNICRPPGELYHGTSLYNAILIQDQGFKIDMAGSNAGTLLGNAVYLASDLQQSLYYARMSYVGIVLKLQVNMGRIRKIFRGDPLLTTWMYHGYDTAWCPAGVYKDMEENAIADPSRIKIVDMFAVSTVQLQNCGYGIYKGRLYKTTDIDSIIINDALSLDYQKLQLEDRRLQLESIKLERNQYNSLNKEKIECRKRLNEIEADRDEAKREVIHLEHELKQVKNKYYELDETIDELKDNLKETKERLERKRRERSEEIQRQCRTSHFRKLHDDPYIIEGTIEGIIVKIRSKSKDLRKLYQAKEDISLQLKNARYESGRLHSKYYEIKNEYDKYLTM